MSQGKLQGRSGSFERASQRKSQQEAAHYMNEHLAMAQINHRERCGVELPDMDELKSIVSASRDAANDNAEAALKNPKHPSLELLALLEGKVREDEERQSWEGIQSAARDRFSAQLGKAGLQTAATGGSVFAALRTSLLAFGESLSADDVVKWLEEKGSSYRVHGVQVSDFVTWGQLPLECSSNEEMQLAVPHRPESWSNLLHYLRTCEAPQHVGADWLVLVVAAHVTQRNIVVYSSTFNVAVRFVPENEWQPGFEPTTHLSPGAAWLRIGLLEGQHFVAMQPIPLRAEGLKTKLDSMDAQMDQHIKSSAGRLPAVMLFGLTGVGKSTMMHILSGRQMIRVDDGTQVTITVADDFIPGSKISASANSETKAANAVYIDMCGEQCLLIDTPGFGDTEGEVDNIVSAMSCAKVMRMCSSLRVVLLVNQSDIVNSRMSTFCELASTISKLFANFEMASSSLAIWVNKRDSDADYDEIRLSKLLKKAAKEKTNAHARSVLSVLVRQLDSQPLRVIKYSLSEEESDSDDEITIKHEEHSRSDDSEVLVMPPDSSGSDSDDEKGKKEQEVTFEFQRLLRQLYGMKPLDSPADHCRLPLSESAETYLKELVREVSDQCTKDGEPDFTQIKESLGLLEAIMRYFKSAEPSTTGIKETELRKGVKEATRIVSSQYESASLQIKSRVEEQVALRMNYLSTIFDPTHINAPLPPAALHGFCWSRRCLGEASRLISSHIDDLPSVASVSERFAGLILSLCEQTVQLQVSDPTVAIAFLKLKQLCDYFSVDDLDPVFAEMGNRAQESLEAATRSIVMKLDELVKQAHSCLLDGLQAASDAIHHSVSSIREATGGNDKADTKHPNEAISLFDTVGDLLRTAFTAEDRLKVLVMGIDGTYASACNRLEKPLRALVEELIVELEGRSPQFFKLTVALASLSEARQAFKLREHFDQDAPAHVNTLDMLYEKGVESIVKQHQLAIERVLEDAQLDDFVSRICNHKAELEFMQKLYYLGDSPHFGRCSKLARDIQGRCSTAQKSLEFKVHGQLEYFTKDAVDEVHDLESSRSSYASHRARLTLLEETIWWDALSGEFTITKAVETLWRAFEKRVSDLATGPDGIETHMRNHDYKSAVDRLNKLWEMTPLWTVPSASPSLSCSAQALKDKVDLCIHSVRTMLQGKFTSMRSLMNIPSWSTSEPPRVDRHVWEGLMRADRFLDLSMNFSKLDTELLRALIDARELDGQSELRDVQIKCESRVEEEFQSMKARVVTLSSAISESRADKLTSALEVCCADDVREVLRVLHSKAKHPVLFAQLYTDQEAGETPDFYMVENALSQSLKAASQHFPRLRLADQKALIHAMTDIERALQNDPLLASLKKDFGLRQETMAERFASHIEKSRSAVIEEFMRKTYTLATWRKMVDLQKVGEDSDEFADACFDLQRSLEERFKDVRNGILIFSFTPPEAMHNFKADDWIVSPWLSLIQARDTGHAEFLKVNQKIQEARGSPIEHFDLLDAIDRLSDEFYSSVSSTLKPLAAQFCQNEIEASDKCITAITAIIYSLRSASGLYEKVHIAIGEVESLQKAHLDSLAEPCAESSCEGSDEGTSATFQGRSLKGWLAAQGKLLKQLEKLCLKRGPLQANYQKAFRTVVSQTAQKLHSHFEPVLNDSGWRDMGKEQLEQIDTQLHVLTRWLENETSMTVSEELQISDEQVALARDRITARRRGFVVVNFEGRAPSEQAAIIDQHINMPSEYSDFVDKYREGQKKVYQEFVLTRRACSLDDPSGFRPRELSDTVIRMRDYAQYDTFNVSGEPDLEPFLGVEREVQLLCDQQIPTLTDTIAQLKMPSSRDSFPLDKKLKLGMQFLVEVVLITIDSRDRTIPKGDPSSNNQVMITFNKSKQCAGRVLAQASELVELLVSELSELAKRCVKPASCPADLVAMKFAMRRLQHWEGVPGEISIFAVMEDLANLLVSTDASASTSNEDAAPLQRMNSLLKMIGTHRERVHNINNVICKQLEQAFALLTSDYDPEKDMPLEKELFELALCKQMEELVDEIAWQAEIVHEKRHAIRSYVQEYFANFKVQLDNLLLEKKYKEIGNALKSLKKFQHIMELKDFESCKGRNSDYYEDLRQHASNITDKALEFVPMSSEPGEFAGKLILLKQLEDGIPTANRAVREGISKILAAVQKKYPRGMVMLGVQLKSIDSVLGSAIVNSSEVFAALRVTLFNARTQMPFEDVLAKLEVDAQAQFDKDDLRAKFQDYEKQYEKDMNMALHGLMSEDPIQYLAQLAVTRAQKPSSIRDRVCAKFGIDVQKQVPKVLAAIFALWSTQFYLRTHHQTSGEESPTIRKPHYIQVLCILRMLSTVGSSDLQLANHLAEVPTGEGKSLVLAATAATIALYGYHIDCVCYSSNLSKRDFEQFQSLFAALGLQDGRIRYGTFDTLAEKLMTEKHGDVRSQILAALKGENAVQSGGASNKPPDRVLLIDEVDVFLDPSFFSGTYTPCLTIQDSRIAALMQTIWKDPTKDPTKLSEFSELFKKPAAIAKTFEWFARSAAYDMQRTAQDFQKAPQKRGVHYELLDGWVMYKSQDALVRSNRLTYSSLTNCVYLYEHQRGNINDQQLLDHGLYMHATCGEFSYALLPSTTAYHKNVPAFYKFILGVSGTLREEKLPQEAREVLCNEILIEHFTYCPSMYGELKRAFDVKSKDDIQLTSSLNEHYVAINEEIIRRLKPTSDSYKGKRAVLVFFESNQELESFYLSPQFSCFKNNANRLTETSAREPEELDSLVSKATRQGQITLASRSYGRGIDFVVDDEHMVTCGGLHVLLTFFPKEVQEEVQIMGRGARQGEKGSFSMVMRIQQLEDFAGDKATADEIKQWATDNSLYEEMSKLRQQQASVDMDQRIEMAKDAKRQHLSAVQALTALKARGKEQKQLIELLKKYNLVNSSTGTRTMFILDVTFSMEPLIEKTKACICEFFSRCQKVLDAESICSGFELQIVTYSNYNVPVDQIVESSTWEAKPNALVEFLRDLKTRGGWGSEAIECGLMHALNEHKKRPLDQIILIGDAPANTLADIREKRCANMKSEEYWAAQLPSWAPEGIDIIDSSGVLAKIQAVKPVPLHAYFMAERAKSNFEQLASKTGGGTHQELKVQSQYGAQLLTDAVCKQILSSLGGQTLKDAYDRMKPSFNRD